MMFRFFFISFLLSATNLLPAQATTIVPAHQVVQLTTIDETIAAEVRHGDLITLRVLLDVRINATLIIRHGAWAQAQVRYRHGEAQTRKPELVLVPILVQGADGTLIDLYGEGVRFGGRGRRARQQLPPKQQLKAYVRYTTRLFENNLRGMGTPKE